MYIHHFRISEHFLRMCHTFMFSTFAKLIFSSIVYGSPTLFRNLHIENIKNRKKTQTKRKDYICPDIYNLKKLTHFGSI